MNRASTANTAIVQNHININTRSIDCASYQIAKDKQTSFLADTSKKATELVSLINELKTNNNNDKATFFENMELKEEYVDHIAVDILCANMTRVSDNKIAWNKNMTGVEDSPVDQELAKTTACLEEASNSFEDELQCILNEIELIDALK